MKLSIIIVNYKTYALTAQTLKSVLKQDIMIKMGEVILVDNASFDGSIEQIKKDFKDEIDQERLKIICNEENLGFSKANNIGIKIAKGEYVLLLNSDTVVEKDTLESCVNYLEEHPKVGALGCKVVLESGELDHACKRGFPTPLASLYYLLKLDRKNPLKYGQYKALHISENQEGEVDCLTGAFMLMPRQVIQEVKGLDETFFMYGEDIDLCYRIKLAGYKVIYYPKVKIIHYKGGSSKRKRYKVIYNFHKAMWIFYRKNYIKNYNIGVTVLVFIGIWGKYGVEILRNLCKRKN